MSNIKKLRYIFFLLSITSGYGQEIPTFNQRLNEIENQLDLLSESSVPGLNESANFSVSNISIQSFLRTIAESHKLNVQVDPSLNITLSNNFTNVIVKDIVYFLCQEYQLDIRFINTIMSFSRYELPIVSARPNPVKKSNILYDEKSGVVTLDLNGDSLRTFARELTKLTNKNVIVSGVNELDGKMISGFINDLPFESAIEKLAYVNNLKLTKSKDGVYIFEGLGGSVGQSTNRSNQVNVQSDGEVVVKDSLITIDVVNYPILEIIYKASSQLGVNYILFTDITGSTTAKVKDVSYRDLLAFLFQGTNFTYKLKNEVYLLGPRNHEGFRTTELVKLDFRTIEGVDKEIPSELSKDVELKLLKELNALIITGNKHKIDEVLSFIRLIDRPIPNILIEVIVADARKGFSIETGLKAFLSQDSVPKTQGQIFPGIDLTVSSKSVNEALEKLDSKGIVNLGRVTPNFYATLQALEQNNNIQVRSTPKLSTMNGSKATLIIGESVYYVEQTQNITGGVNPITTTAQRFNKVEANLSINISPVVSGNEHITLDITAEFSDFINPTIPNAPPGSATRKFESKIRIKNEEMIILGGLEEVSRSETSSGVPLLSRIPVIKWIFSSRSKQNANNRLIVFIKPTLVY